MVTGEQPFKECKNHIEMMNNVLEGKEPLALKTSNGHRSSNLY